MLVCSLTNCSATKPHLPASPRRIAARLAKRGIVLIKHLNAIISPVADINLAVIGDLHAMHGVAKECGLFVAFGIVGDPRPGGLGGCVVDGIVSIGAEMADIFTGVGVNDQDAAVSVAVGDVQAVRCGIDHHVRRLIEQWRAINTTMRVVAVWSLWSSADPHLEIAVHIKLQYKAVAAVLVRRPRRCSSARSLSATGAAAEFPEIQTLSLWST